MEFSFRFSQMKILVLQFKYFGDAVLLTPALRALHRHFPAAELHVLVPAEMAPLFQHLPWIARVWPMPRKRGASDFSRIWPFLRELRRAQFDRSVDFAGNDRGAILSRLIGAKERLGWNLAGGFFGRKFCYTTRVTPPKGSLAESARLVQLLAGWQMPTEVSLAAEIRSDVNLVAAAQKILPAQNAVVCHVASSQQKKEWPLNHWASLHQLAAVAGIKMVFTTAHGEREAALLAEFKKLAPTAEILPPVPELPLFLAVLARAKVFVSGDTGPLHFAAGLGVPTLSLFGPTRPERWAPVGARHQFFTGGRCDCSGHSAVCHGARHCLAEISPETVFAALQKNLVQR
jgi:heptosyltransferase III